jgi:hypothetical protein
MYARALPQHLLANCQVLAERSMILPLLRKRSAVCEIGVALGDFSARILEQCDVTKFYAIDFFRLEATPDMWHGRIGEVLSGMTHLDWYRTRFASHVAAGVLEVLKGDSSAMLGVLPDQAVDFFYIDANHSYEHVKRELSVIKSKIAPGGWIMLDDYTLWDIATGTPYGVVQATNEFMISEGWEMIYFVLHGGMYCNVVIRKLSA